MTSRERFEARFPSAALYHGNTLTGYFEPYALPWAAWSARDAEVAALTADLARMREALAEVGDWDHRGGCVAEQWDEMHGAGAWAALAQPAQETPHA